MARYLTKTRYVDGRTCPKRLWLEVNAPARLPTASAPAQHRMQQGRRLGEIARRRFPHGILVEGPDIESNLRRSHDLLEKRVPLFEPGFRHPGVGAYARADVLRPAGTDQWDILEVKSTLYPHDEKAKEDHLQDVAFQHWCYAGAGLNIRRCSLLLLNPEYVRAGEIDPNHLFREMDITQDVATLAPEVPASVANLLAITRAEVCPEFGRGESFHPDEEGIHDDDAIWHDHPDSDIQELWRSGRRALAWLEAGVFRIRDVPREELNANQAIQQAAQSSGRAYVDPKKIASFVEGLHYPLHFLDFETFQSAIPLFDGSYAYQQIPFQFSLHVVERPGQSPVHHSHLSMEPVDPRRRFAEALRAVIGTQGDVVTWNVTFEKQRLTELAGHLPEHSAWIHGVEARLVDLWVPFRKFWYYDPRQRGSTSLKAVLPAMIGRDYDDLVLHAGGEASLAYLRAVWGRELDEEVVGDEVPTAQKDLEAYCGRDTEGMVWIVEKLTGLAQRGG